jgi:hypothetical protein
MIFQQEVHMKDVNRDHVEFVEAFRALVERAQHFGELRAGMADIRPLLDPGHHAFGPVLVAEGVSVTVYVGSFTEKSKVLEITLPVREEWRQQAEW